MHIRRSLHQDARAGRGREDAPTGPEPGEGGTYQTRVPLLIGMLISASRPPGVCRRRALLFMLAAIAVCRGGKLVSKCSAK